jgi:hypothetical protein
MKRLIGKALILVMVMLLFTGCSFAGACKVGVCGLVLILLSKTVLLMLVVKALRK